MRKITVLIAALAVMALTVGTAIANPVIAITKPADGHLLETTSFPYDLEVEGLLTYNEGPAQLRVSINGEEVYQQNNMQGTNVAWAFSHEVAEPGVYDIRAVARHGEPRQGSDQVEVEIIEERALVVSFPAAPSVAGKLLAENGASHKYGSGKNGGNHIADVARHMGPGTEFDGVKKSDVAAYRAAVDAFLDGRGAYNK